MKNRFFNILVPGVFLPMCLGTVYNFSQYSANIMQCFDITKFAADIGFTLIIFCLGFGAAIFGRQVELNPKKMAIVASVLFVLGVLGLSLSTATQFLPLYYLSCAVMGTGTGIGYVSPIKQLMSAYEDHKGMASGLAISGFGLGKFVAAPIYEYLLANCSLPVTFLLIGCLFAVILGLSNCLFKPDPRYVSTIYTAIPIKNLLKNKFLTMSYISVWLMFCINISCGLAIISQEKGLLLNLGFTDIALILSITAIMNILGRFGFSTLSDYKGRKAVYHFICSFGILAALFCFTGNPALSLVGIFLCELAYGGNFSSLPSLLSKYFGASSVSTVHAMTLTGWGCAGIFSILLANFFTTSTLFIILGILYLIGFVMMEVFLKQR